MNKLKVAGIILIDFFSITLDAVVKETLRMYPVIPFVLRRATEDTQVRIGNHVVPCPQGSNVIFSIYSLGADKSFWNKPDDMDITRWDRRDEKNEEKTESGAWLPFGLGWRNCVGAR